MAPFRQHVVFLYVADLAASVAFYTSQLGLPVVLRQPGCTIMRVTEASFLGVCEREVENTAGLIVTFVPDDLDATYEQLRGAGVPCDGPPRYNERYDIVQFFATDPDGYMLEFQRFCSEEWPA